MLAKCTAVLIWLLAVILRPSHAEVDCNMRIPYPSLGSCCATPEFHYESFRQRCGKYIKDNAALVSPCLHECLFNATNALSGMQLNVGGARKMLQLLLANNTEFVDIFQESLQNCTESARNIKKFNRRQTYGGDGCSHFPIFLGMCTMETVMAHCPPASWTSSQFCEKAREFKLNCKCDPTGRKCTPIQA